MPATLRCYRSAQLALMFGLGATVAGAFSLQHLGVIIDETGASGGAPLYAWGWVPFLSGLVISGAAGAAVLATRRRMRQLVMGRTPLTPG